MTRNEEIKQAAQEMGLWQAGEAMFKFGAEWADEWWISKLKHLSSTSRL